jgi:2-succinyl-5-enolpyruvyl-6-hydroxy-3-cyclohexene-1-carboxylate synthase
MQIKVNRNYLWSNIFFDQLVECGVKYACISPGSRSTPLTYSLSQNKKIKSFVIVDERSSGFFALGIAKQTNSPVIVVTTSGTAAAELYPAIVEAYQNRVPLIICSADRPAYLRNTGANQTIDQENLYNKYVRYFYDAGLPKLDIKNIKLLKKNSIKAFEICSEKNIGPVHINFPFEKPLEPNSFTDELEENILIETLSDKKTDDISNKYSVNHKKEFDKIYSLIKKNNCGLITVGPGNFSSEFAAALEKFSIKFSLPVFADASSGLRFKANSISNLISNYDALVRSSSFTKIFSPKFIFHFGRTLTSPKLEEFQSLAKSKRFIINKFVDLFGAKEKSILIKMNEAEFLSSFNEVELSNHKNSFDYVKILKLLDNKILKVKIDTLTKTQKLNEPDVLLNILNAIPPNSNLMIGNSLPIRDMDYFASAINKNINIYQNRGASGIDGITSTALGICASSKNPSYLITGDLSFYYDINSLLIARQCNIPLITIVINNDGGAIFKFLPIAEYHDVFEKYFVTPTKLSFEKIVEAFNIDYKEIKDQQDLLNHIKVSSVRTKPVVFEIKTNADYSLSLRKKYWKQVSKVIEKFLRSYEN